MGTGALRFSRLRDGVHRSWGHRQNYLDRQRGRTADQLAEGTAGFAGDGGRAGFGIVRGGKHAARAKGVHARRIRFAGLLCVQRALGGADSGDKCAAGCDEVEGREKPAQQPERAIATLDASGIAGEMRMHRSDLVPPTSGRNVGGILTYRVAHWQAGSHDAANFDATDCNFGVPLPCNFQS